MRRSLCFTNNLHSSQVYKYINNSRQLSKGSAKWIVCGTEQPQGQNLGKGVWWEGKRGCYSKILTSDLVSVRESTQVWDRIADQMDA